MSASLLDSRLETREEAYAYNHELYEKLATDRSELLKEAEAELSDFTRLKLREQGFARHILPPQKATTFDRTLTSTKPLKLVDMEIDSPLAVAVPLNASPIQYNIRARRYAVGFDRVYGPRYGVDVAELLTNNYDIRQVLSDNTIKDMEYKEDSKLLAASNALLVGVGVTLPATGTAMYRQITDGITRDSTVDALKVQPDTPFAIDSMTCLLNHITFKEWLKWRRDEFGGDVSAEIAKRGTAAIPDLFGRTWVVTIKKQLVPNNHLRTFGAPKFLGRFYTIEDVTMHVKREGPHVEFFPMAYYGMTLAHQGALSHIEFVN